MRKSKFLTGRQRVVFDFVRQKIYEGLPPTIYEIAANFGFSPPRANEILYVLQKKGYLHLEANKRCAISLLPPYKDDTRHSFVVKEGVPELDIQKGDSLLIDTAKPVEDGDVILSTQGEIKRFSAGDTAFGKVVGFSRTID